jgi:hypothetical protein
LHLPDCHWEFASDGGYVVTVVEELVSRCLMDEGRAQWVLRVLPEFKTALTANELLFGTLRSSLSRLHAVRVLREFDYVVTEEMKQRCIQRNMTEHLCALLSYGYLSTVPPKLDRMSCRDKWLSWTPVTHGLIKDLEVTQRVVAALCCFRVYCPHLPKDLKGLILTIAMSK